MRNQTSFRLTTTLLPTDTTAKTTYVINKVDADGNQFYPTFSEETVVITNDDKTIMETTRATCNNGVLTFVKRGLSDDSSATVVENRKLTWNPGSICFITAGAADMVDVDDDITRTGKQTYTGEMVAQGKATYKGQLVTEKGVKYPSFADTTALNAYSSPFGGMFATVDSTGELYRYNAKTEQWDMVSSVALGTYEIQVDDEAPEPGTADTIITISPEQNQLYVGTDPVVKYTTPYYADVLVVGAGGLGGGGCCTDGWGSGSSGGGGAGGFGEAFKLSIDATTTVKVGCSNFSNMDTITNYDRTSSFGKLVATGGCDGCAYDCSNPKGGDKGISFYDYTYSAGTGLSCSTCCKSGGGGGAGAGGNGGDGYTNDNYHIYGGGGGQGRKSMVDGCIYGYGGGGDCCGGGGSACGSGGDGIANRYSSTCRSCAKGGIVVVRYPADGSYGYSCASGGTASTCCMNGTNYCLHTFTSDGTFCVVS